MAGRNQACPHECALFLVEGLWLLKKWIRMSVWASTMGELIHLQEIDQERRRNRARVRERVHLERAVTILRENLASAAEALRDAPVGEQAELLSQVEKLTAMVRYGLRMLGETLDAEVPVRRDLD
jgi:hypothetical protein